MTEKVIIEIEVTDCFHCPFLNSSDVGEDCNILRQGIREDEWSNIGFQFDENWRYERCPLINPYHLRKNCGVKIYNRGVK